jgi:hypothetical protein
VKNGQLNDRGVFIVFLQRKRNASAKLGHSTRFMDLSGYIWSKSGVGKSNQHIPELTIHTLFPGYSLFGNALSYEKARSQ